MPSARSYRALHRDCEHPAPESVPEHGLSAAGPPSASRARRIARKAAIFPLVALIRLYQWCISPYLRPACRFEPSCSKYALEALRRHGPLKGTWLAVKRLSRCHPWGGHGYDPVP